MKGEAWADKTVFATQAGVEGVTGCVWPQWQFGWPLAQLLASHI